MKPGTRARVWDAVLGLVLGGMVGFFAGCVILKYVAWTGLG